jgi:hypothetical protein
VQSPNLVSVAEEWFRSSEWDVRAQEEFEKRLGRASSSYRPQYLRIKALALMDHGGDAEALGARELLVRLIETYPGSGDVVMAHEHLGELDAREGHRSTAEAHFRAAMRLVPERKTRGDAALRFPELLIEDDTDESRSEARQVLDAIQPGSLVFASQRFRFAVAHARLAQAEGDDAEARRHAENALKEAGRDAPDFPRHPTVGLVTADKTVINEMQKLAGR